MNKLIAVSIFIILAGGIFGNVLRFTEKMPGQSADFSKIPVNHPDYLGVEQQIADFAYEILQADVTTLRDYLNPDLGRYQLFIAYFNSQKYGSQIHSPKHCLPGGGWRIENIEPYELRLQDGTVKTVNRLIISLENYKAVMIYWFETRSGSIRNEYGLKIDLIKNALLMKPTDAAIVRLTIDAADGNFERATRSGLTFLNEFHPYIMESLPF